MRSSGTTPLSPATPSRWRQAAPAVTLLILSPIIAELLFGVTRVTTLFLLIPQIGAWGCGALIIRHLARRPGKGPHAILLLGIALAVAEECVIQQTSLAPLVGVDPEHVYARSHGVNWVYFLWALGYESVWAVVIPIRLTELIFPARRDEPWIGKRGLAISAAAFVLASFVAWYSWTQIYVPKFFPESAYRVPASAIVLALAAIVALAALALGRGLPPQPDEDTTRPAPEAWFVGLVGFALALPWFALVFLAYGGAPALKVPIPMAGGAALAGLAFLLVRRWRSSSGWADAHRLALILGALMASMLAGFWVLRASGAPAVDVIGKLAFNAIAIALLVRLARRAPRAQGAT